MSLIVQRKSSFAAFSYRQVNRCNADRCDGYYSYCSDGNDIICFPRIFHEYRTTIETCVDQTRDRVVFRIMVAICFITRTLVTDFVETTVVA